MSRVNCLRELAHVLVRIATTVPVVACTHRGNTLAHNWINRRILHFALPDVLDQIDELEEFLAHDDDCFLLGLA